ncbi:glycosyltransferase [Nocardioides lianchengensis]|uniref:Phosphatidylinositol alpha 1,6-mannosyltransferase n=1 Tax=Nocardioides lianchengensis TaxID=1045774 RepID=A0A1G6IYM6_9ACTN|nr:glycosyltransferase [Nocardioides lianchengensis]NYG12918.1 phosphatidylinositol alpha 1,6-mannosyltransferase [Nocardioides lianchengensis]SDC11175.1 phosphatidylinositol alpha 1,6-mannosyltransferase [Nocardioides lianchengensis]
MRIALVTETFYPAVDGATTTVKAVADRLIDTGHEVRIIAPGPGLSCYRHSEVVRLRPLDKPGGQVRDALASYRPDVVHVTSPGTVGRKALKHAARLGIPSVVVQQAPVPDLTADYWRAKVADRAGRVLVTAPWMVDRVAALGVEAALWEPGVDTDAFTPALRDAWLHGSWSRARSKQGPLVTVGYVGSLHRRHGVRRLPELNAVAGIRPVVIGAGPQRDWLRSRMPQAKLTGALETGDLTVALATLDVLVHPGTEETCCHALREAAASGVPVVAPGAGGARDVVRPLETGLLYDPEDPHGLVRAVRAVTADRQRALLGARARELATRDWRQAVDELVERHYGVFSSREIRPTTR